MGNLLDPIEGPDVVESVDRGTQTTVKAENLVFDESGEGKVVEEIGEIFPDIGVAVFAQTFVVKSIDLCDLAGLVVSTENRDTLGVTDLKANEERDRFNRVVTTVDVIT